jgi:EAL domain-containing protein (putative c-di-GMP-specific phosphodiesterase class I)
VRVRVRVRVKARVMELSQIGDVAADDGGSQYTGLAFINTWPVNCIPINHSPYCNLATKMTGTACRGNRQSPNQ